MPSVCQACLSRYDVPCLRKSHVGKRIGNPRMGNPPQRSVRLGRADLGACVNITCGLTSFILSPSQHDADTFCRRNVISQCLAPMYEQVASLRRQHSAVASTSHQRIAVRRHENPQTNPSHRTRHADTLLFRHRRNRLWINQSHAFSFEADSAHLTATSR